MLTAEQGIILPGKDGRSAIARARPVACIILFCTLSFVSPFTVASASSASERSWASLHKSAIDALDTNRYWMAEPLLNQSLAEAEKLGSDSLHLATSLGDLARFYIIRGKFREAEPLLERELQVRKAALGPADDKIITASGSLVRYYFNYGTRDKADPLAEEILASVQNKISTAASPSMDWALTCDSIGYLYRASGKYDLAEKFFKTSLQIKTTIVGAKHLSLASTLENLGSLYLAMKNYSQAEYFYREAYQATANILRTTDADVFNRLDKLAQVLVLEGKFDEAEALYRKIVASWKTNPPKHNGAARAWYALGCINLERKQFSQAVPLLRMALGSEERMSGPCSIALYPYLDRYAYALSNMGRASEGQRMRARADAVACGSPPDLIR